MIFFGAIGAVLIGATCLIILSHFSMQRPLTKLSLNLSILTVFLSLGSFLVGFIIWAAIVKLEPGDCTRHKFPTSSAKSVCGKEGTEIAIATIVLLFITSVFYFIIANKIYKAEAQQTSGEQYGNRLV